MKITLKLASTLDGRIATRTGESKWITSAESRQVVHELRAAHDAVLVGVNTVIADDPMLNARNVSLPNGRQPHRIILDTNLRTPETSNVLRETDEDVFIICGGVPTWRAVDCFDRAEIIPVGFGADGRLDLQKAMDVLEQSFSIRSVFIEGGGQVAASFLKAGLVDVLEWFRAPMLIGGDGIPALGELNVSALSDALRFERKGVRMVGADVWETYERKAD